MAWTQQANSKSHQRWSGDVISATAANASSNLDISAFNQADIAVNHAGHDVTSTWAYDWSNDGGTTWERIGTKTTSGASGSTSVSISDLPGSLLRIIVTETDPGVNPAFAPTLTPYITLKREAD